LCAKFHKILCKKIATVTSSQKIDIFNCKVFPTKLHAHKSLGRENLQLFLRPHQKVFADPWFIKSSVNKLWNVRHQLTI